MVLPNFKENLEKYAKLLVANGVNVQPGHTLALNIDVEQRELAHLIVKEAYALGAHEVIIQWADDFTNREKFLHAPMDRLDNVPDYKIAEMNYLLDHKASRLGVRSSDPGALNGVDAEKLSASAKALGMAMKPMRIATQSNKVSWTVAAAAGLEWAKKGSNLQDLPGLRRRSSQGLGRACCYSQEQGRDAEQGAILSPSLHSAWNRFDPWFTEKPRLGISRSY